MSRRSHHRGNRGTRPGRPDPGQAAPRPAPAPLPAPEGVPHATHAQAQTPEPTVVARPAPRALPFADPVPPASAPTIVAPQPYGPAPAPVASGAAFDASSQAAPANGCTAPQLRRFIKSRAWVPMHELRRRFGINGQEDDVTLVAVDGSTIFVGLPTREGQLLGELFRAGDIGYELSLDPFTPIVIGVYPMRPVPRH